MRSHQLFRSSVLLLGSSLSSSSSSSTVKASEPSSTFIPSHSRATEYHMTRSPSFARQGRLERNHLVNQKNKRSSNERRPWIDREHAVGDALMNQTGKLDYWRSAVSQATRDLWKGYSSKSGIPPQWDVVVPLLESIREEGRSKFWKPQPPPAGNIGSTMYNPTTAIFFENCGARKNSTNLAPQDQDLLLPTGERYTPKEIQKQFQLELFLRLPLLERTLEHSTTTPIIIGRFFRALQYCSVPLPSVETFLPLIHQNSSDSSSNHNTESQITNLFLNKKLRLRTMSIAAMRKMEMMLFEEDEESANGFRKRRKLVLEASVRGSVFDFIEGNRQTFLDCQEIEKTLKLDDGANEKQVEILSKILNIDVSKEVPKLLQWAEDGKKFLLEQEKEGSSALPLINSSRIKPLDWSRVTQQQQQQLEGETKDGEKKLSV